MRHGQLPLSALPAWAKLNDVDFYDVRVQYLPGRGHGLATTRSLSSEEIFDSPTLLSIPQNMILSAEAIEEHTRTDKHFRELRRVAAFTVPRQVIMLFLLQQLSMSSPDIKDTVGVSNPWTEYARMLPVSVPSPTTWTESQRQMLIGTSLESIVDAKISALSRQFDNLRQNTKDLAWCQKAWFDSDTVNLHDWIHVDSLYRSRSLEIPDAGECMIPCVDMANHSVDPNAFYDRSKSGEELLLLLRPDRKVNTGDEITISYGEVKSAAEMLFSYGFIDSSITSTTELMLNLQPMGEDPLGEAKLFAFPGAPSVKIIEDDVGVRWSSSFIYLMCLNEEDGLEFKLTQHTDGTAGSLHTFFNDADVSEKTACFEELTAAHPLHDVFTLRCVAILQDLIQSQIERLYASEDTAQFLGMLPENADVATPVLHLRVLETNLLERVFVMLDDQKNELVQSAAVQEYLGLSADEEDNKMPEMPENVPEDSNEDDFS